MPVEIADDRPRVEIELEDGSVATLSPVVPDDLALFEEGLDKLSVESRFTRFGQGIAHLTRAELDYLTDVDQRSHVAWGALVDGEIAGAGRYVAREDGCSEVALTVIDEYQHRGLGSVLLGALVAVAVADGVEELCFEVVPGNVAVEHLLDGVDLRPDDSGSLIEGRVRVSDLPESPRADELVAVMNACRGQGAWRPSA
ncbi:MAG: GNAT family N-acetyltransferase [Acidimicrobiia bacterium]|nr:GNAT family N-acetyltransferase [Acidimicrobiia bacterium]